MKALLIAILMFVTMGSAYASRNALDSMHIGTYRAVAHSSDLGKVWVSWGELVGTFNEDHMVLQEGVKVPYLRVLYSDYDQAQYTFIQVNYNDIIEITDVKPGVVLLQYLQNGKEVERYICTIVK